MGASPRALPSDVSQQPPTSPPPAASGAGPWAEMAPELVAPRLGVAATLRTTYQKRIRTRKYFSEMLSFDINHIKCLDMFLYILKYIHIYIYIGVTLKHYDS